MKQLLSHIQKLNRYLTEKGAIVGYVEQIEGDFIRGWVINKTGKVSRLTLEVESQSLPVILNWTERADVAGKFGQTQINCGFELTLPNDTRGIFNSALAEGKAFKVIADGKVLPVLGSAGAAKHSAKSGLVADKVAIAYDHADFHVKITGIGHFSIKGQIALKTEIELAFGLTCNDQPMDVYPILTQSNESARRNRRSDARVHDFTLDIPGYIWEFSASSRSCQIRLVINGSIVNHEALVIDEHQACRWLEEIALMRECKDKQYLNLLALEHIRYGQFLAKLGEKAERAMVTFAENIQLDEFIADGMSRHIPIQARSPGNLMLWRGLRLLNQRLGNDNASLYAELQAVIEELKLDKDQCHQLYKSVLPLFCKHRQLELIFKDLNLTRFSQMAESKNVWDVTLAIPVLLAQGLVDKATDAVKRTLLLKDRGWINTDCLAYALKQVHALEAGYEISKSQAVSFRLETLAFLEELHGQWFSRAHDENFIEMMVEMVFHARNHDDRHRRDIITAAIRIYGMNPRFWLGIKKLGLNNFDDVLHYSHGQYLQFESLVNDPACRLDTHLEEIRHVLSYFLDKKNGEAVIYLREICTHCLPAINQGLASDGLDLLRQLFFHDRKEAMRIAAFPLEGHNRLLQFPETSSQMLRESIRLASDARNCPFTLIQEEAAQFLSEMGLGSNHDNAVATANFSSHCLENLVAKLAILSTEDANFLAFDLLAGMYVDSLNKQDDAACEKLLKVLGKILDNIISSRAGETGAVLPAPVMNGIYTLSSVSGTSKQGSLQAFLDKINAKLSWPRSAIFDTSKSAAYPVGRSWPRDTLVLLYSCRKYMDSRVEVIRKNWIQELIKRGIPYLVVVGDGDDSVAGDELRLDVSDRYEDLPRKTLKMLEWVYKETDARFILKIDDDCYLDVERYFDTLNYRKYHYYGRMIRRGIGSTDRIWHQQKSTSLRGQKCIDKSPEPSIYADGGGAYTLSCHAIEQLLAAADTAEGKKLISYSFMEDKLVGDLLKLSGISLSDEDYHSYQRRRTFDQAMPVARWENTFYPGPSTPTKMTHLDSEKGFEQLNGVKHSQELWPKKIWPTAFEPMVKLNSNQLEILSSAQKLAELLKQELVLISVIRNEMLILPHFLAHYRALGVQCFAFVDNCSDDGSREFLMDQTDVVLFSSDTDYKYSYFGVAWQQAIMGNFCIGKWVLLADADEFLVYPNSENKSIQDLIRQITDEGDNAACVYMVDMYPKGGLEDADFKISSPFEAAPYHDRFPVTHWRLGSGWYSNSASTVSHLRHRIAPNAVPHDFVSQKYALFRYAPWIRVSQGLHYAANMKVNANPIWFAHFKYHAEFKKKIEIEIKRKQHFNNAEEYRRYFDMLTESRGKFYNENISVRYKNSDE